MKKYSTKLILLISLVLVLFGIEFSNFIYDQIGRDHYKIYLLVYYLPIFGLILMWALIIKLFIERKKEDLRTASIQIPKTKPRFAFDPKYKTSIDFSGILSKDNSSIDALSAALSIYGFELFSKTTDLIRYERGSNFQIISINKVKLKIFFEIPLKETTNLFIGYGNYTVDNGDLWTFVQELRNNLITSV